MKAKAAAARITSFLKKVDPSALPAGPTEEDKAARSAALLQVANESQALVVASGVNPTLAFNLFGDGKLLSRSFTYTFLEGIYFPSPNTITANVAKAALSVEEVIKVKMSASLSYCIVITDGASFRRDKAVAVLLSSGALGSAPEALDLIWPSSADDAPTVYDYNRAAEDIKAVLRRFDIDMSRVLMLMGDNVNFNNALSRALGVLRGNCYSHALSLCVKHAVPHLPGFRTLVVQASAVIFAGGTHKRKLELEAPPYNLSANKLVYYGNRFGSSISAARYRAEHYDKVAQWYTTGATVAENAVDDDDEEEGDDMGDDVPVVSKATIARVQAAYKDEFSEVPLRAAVELLGDVTELIALSSSNTPPLELMGKLQLLRETLEVAREDPTDIISPAMHKSDYAFPVAAGAKFKDLRDNVAKLSDAVKAAAAAAVERFDKHIKPTLHILQYAARFSPHQQPEVVEVPAMTKEFFGALPEDYGAGLKAQYKMWSTSHNPQSAAGMSAFDYWSSKLSTWPTLAKLGLYWTEMVTSSVAAERSFGILRAIGAPTRAGASRETVTNEWKLRVNRAFLETILEGHVKVLEEFEGKWPVGSKRAR
jgi:hypothetical protein